MSQNKHLKELYKTFAQEEKLPIYVQPYWLDAVCGTSNWNVVLVNNGNDILASMPYYMEAKKGFKMCWMPPLTQSLGAYFKYPDNQKTDSRLSFEKRCLKELIRQLPAHDFFLQNFGLNFNYCSPLKWLGYAESTRYTFVLSNIKDHKQLENNYSSDLRRGIRKAEKSVKIELTNDIKEVYRLISLSYEKSNGNLQFDFALLNKLYQVLNEKKQCFCVLGKYENKAISAAFIVWDDKKAYYIAGGSDPDYVNKQSQSLLLHEAIKLASKYVDTFDFEGSMNEKIEQWFRAFGAHPVPYFNISKINNKKFKLLKSISDMIK